MKKLLLLGFIINFLLTNALLAQDIYKKVSIGVSIKDTKEGILITESAKNGYAYKAGIRTNDIIIAVDNIQVKTLDSFIDIIRSSPHKSLSIAAIRDEREIFFNVTPHKVDYRYFQLVSVLEEQLALANKLYSNEDYENALYLYKQAEISNKGNDSIQNQLGIMYEEGKGIDIDILTAIDWYKKAAEQDNKYAQYNLGNIYQYGRDNFESDLNTAEEWYKLANLNGHSGAKEKLSDLENPFYYAIQGTVNFVKENSDEIIAVGAAVAVAVVADQLDSKNYCFDPYDDTCTNAQEKHHTKIYHYVSKKELYCSGYKRSNLQKIGLTFLNTVISDGVAVDLFGLDEMSSNLAASGIEIYQEVCD